ncbi:hypothetical protein [Hymenobacter sp. YC55]|uniref:hypothetical protein n=1 Tax=Hymenobacter sp. YC55 TaxID=3034019 RepID=UPI0023F8D1F7|nr:hypothetical protein [Hymenobacter sp. YC55]MDF7815339.1 hypothetical protein [Hymenobacter sp. YC55]
MSTNKLSFQEKLIIVVIGLAGFLFLGGGLYEDVRPRPVTRIHGIIVDKQWQKPYQVHYKHSSEWRPSRFLVWVANRESIRSVEVDSVTWGGLRIGQPSSYRYTPRNWW